MALQERQTHQWSSTSKKDQFSQFEYVTEKALQSGKKRHFIMCCRILESVVDVDVSITLTIAHNLHIAKMVTETRSFRKNI